MAEQTEPLEQIAFGTCPTCGTSGQFVPGTNGREFDIRPVPTESEPQGTMVCRYCGMLASGETVNVPRAEAENVLSSAEAIIAHRANSATLIRNHARYIRDKVRGWLSATTPAAATKEEG